MCNSFRRCGARFSANFYAARQHVAVSEHLDPGNETQNLCQCPGADFDRESFGRSLIHRPNAPAHDQL